MVLLGRPFSKDLSRSFLETFWKIILTQTDIHHLLISPNSLFYVQKEYSSPKEVSDLVYLIEWTQFLGRKSKRRDGRNLTTDVWYTIEQWYTDIEQVFSVAISFVLLPPFFHVIVIDKGISPFVFERIFGRIVWGRVYSSRSWHSIHWRIDVLSDYFTHKSKRQDILFQSIPFLPTPIYNPIGRVTDRERIKSGTQVGPRPVPRVLPIVN